MRTLLVVDAANVVGSVPDGWWRDRHRAAERLRDSLRAHAGNGLPGHPGPLTVVLVVEGAARRVVSVPGVRVESAPGSGDDRIVEVVAEETGRGADVLVATADRELRRRVEAYGARCVGPRTVRPQRGDAEDAQDAAAVQGVEDAEGVEGADDGGEGGPAAGERT